MRFEINRRAMLEAAKSTAKAAPINSPVEVLNGILVECNDDTGEVFLTATNHEVVIQHKLIASVEERGVMLVNARLLVDMMSLLEGELVTLSADTPDKLHVTGGTCKYEIFCLPSKSYPKPTIPFPEESVTITGICSLAKRTTFVVSKDDKTPSLQCVYVKLKNNAVYAAACDGTRMMLLKDSAGPMSEQSFLLPGRALQLLASVSSDTDVYEISEIGREIVFVRGDMIFTMRKLTLGDYIDTDKVIKNIKAAYTAVADAGSMKDALEIILAGAFAGGIKEPVNLLLSGNEILLKCRTDYSETSTSVSARVSADTPDTGFYYNASALLKLFEIIGGKVKLEIDSRGYMLIKTRSEVYLQLPMRVPVKKTKPAKRGKGQERAKGAEDVKETEEVA